MKTIVVLQSNREVAARLRKMRMFRNPSVRIVKPGRLLSSAEFHRRARLDDKPLPLYEDQTSQESGFSAEEIHNVRGRELAEMCKIADSYMRMMCTRRQRQSRITRNHPLLRRS